LRPYATLALARATAQANGISTEWYDNAKSSLDKMFALTQTSVNSLRDFYKTLDENYISQKDALDQVLELTKELIKHENEEMIQALEDEKDAYADIISKKKEALRLAKEQQDHEDDVAEKLKKIAQLQYQIDRLSLDDSREAAAKRKALEEELYELQKELADSQSDYAYNMQVSALDDQLSAYEDEKDKEIQALKDLLSSEEKLYQEAIKRINAGWDALYDDLIDWNYEYGSILQSELENAWDAATRAMQGYFGDFEAAAKAAAGYTNLGDSAGGSGEGTLGQMRQNAINWWASTGGDADNLAAANRALAQQYEAETGEHLDYRDGNWYRPDGSLAFASLTRQEVGKAVVDAMKRNSAAWLATTDQGVRSYLDKANTELAAKLSAFLGQPITRDQNGVWWLGGQKLYDVFHKGGIVGNSTLKQDEVMAVLQKGEAVLDKRKEQALYEMIDFVDILSKRLGSVIDPGRLGVITPVMPGLEKLSGRPSIATNGVGTNVFSPTITLQINTNGELNEAEARRIGNIAAETALERLNGAFTRRGIGNSNGALLRS